MPNYKIEVYRNGKWNLIYNSWGARVRINGKLYEEVTTQPNSFRDGFGNFRRNTGNFR